LIFRPSPSGSAIYRHRRYLSAVDGTGDVSSNALSDRVPVLTGLLAGQVAWVAGYLVTFVVTWRGNHEAVLEAALGDAPLPALYQAAGWVFYNAHGVGVSVEPAARGGQVSSFTATLVGPDGFTPLLYAVPTVCLVAAGALVAVRTDVERPRAGFVAGLTVVPGYVVLAVAGKLATTTAWSMGPGGTASPAAVGVLLAGVLYPAVCAGGAGALVGVVTGRADSPDRSRAGSA
jgi:hypothetical protein